MGLLIFENYSCTNEKTIDKFWHPIKTSISFEELKKLLVNRYKNYRYEENDFDEILFYVEDFELTFELSKLDQINSLLNISVFSKKKRGQTRAYLEETIETIKKMLKYKND